MSWRSLKWDDRLINYAGTQVLGIRVTLITGSPRVLKAKSLWLFFMPPRIQPKIYFLQVKTHKTSVHITLPPTATLAELKQEAYDALTCDVAEPLTRLSGAPKDPNGMEEDIDEFAMLTDTGLPPTEADVVPRLTSLEDFELCKAIKEKGKMTGEFQVVEANDVELKLSGLLMPAQFTLPPIDDDDEDTTQQQRPLAAGEPSNASLGKRKAREQD
ncbi:hypothetical protein NP233_g576 [Leucocoprinus birnbaumii]|uniref:Uncharacterized protein n=1 Tax=Leucocoprinus birnbaumii TaxID=56174 RepID=A0AAD5YWL6_9AGAR|nr:hypothetical protein NP233_g576 [Leucocoprinus birnbaumii]